MAREARTWDDEQAVIQRLKEIGVLVSAGRGYHASGTEMGWVRVGFAVERSKLEEALRRLEPIYAIDIDETVVLDAQSETEEILEAGQRTVTRAASV